MGALGRCASVFLYWRTSQVRQCILACFRFFCLTSFVHIFIRYPFYANSDSISRIFPRRTQWRNPFPLFLPLKINYTLIFNSYVYRKYGVFHSCLSPIRICVLRPPTLGSTFVAAGYAGRVRADFHNYCNLTSCHKHNYNS